MRFGIQVDSGTGGTLYFINSYYYNSTVHTSANFNSPAFGYFINVTWKDCSVPDNSPTQSNIISLKANANIRLIDCTWDALNSIGEGWNFFKIIDDAVTTKVYFQNFTMKHFRKSQDSVPFVYATTLNTFSMINSNFYNCSISISFFQFIGGVNILFQNNYFEKIYIIPPAPQYVQSDNLIRGGSYQGLLITAETETNITIQNCTFIDIQSHTLKFV